MKKPLKVLGIDPGSRLLGFGCLSKSGNRFDVHACGTLRFNTKKSANDRLLEIYLKVKEKILEFSPDQVAFEKVFFAKNVSSALKLGQARGVAMLAVLEVGLPVFEYSPNEVKQAVVGFGHANKEQVAKMVSILSGVKKFETTDASDALAIAICHLNSYTYHERIRVRVEDVPL